MKLTAPDRELLEAIAEAAKAEAAWGDATKRCFASYKTAGLALTAKKDSLEHGQWLQWLKDHVPSRYVSKEDPESEAWIRTAQRWMRIAHILTHAHPSVIESAQTVAQLFRLAQMLPEGGGAGGSAEQIELAPMQVVSRVQRWVAATADFLAPERVREWPAEEREKLLEELKPVRQLLAALEG